MSRVDAAEVGEAGIRSRLLRSLALACELEHGLCLQYLFSAFSLKTSLEEGGLDPAELNTVRKWRGTLFFIAAQEMLHLAQAANIAAALGSAINVHRPNFPQRPNYYPTDLPWGLWPLSYSTLVLYALYERPALSSEHSIRRIPEWLPEPDQLRAQHGVFWQDAPSDKDPFAHLPDAFERPIASRYVSIAELYQQIASDLKQLGPEAFGGHGGAHAGSQVYPGLMDMPQLIPVFTLTDALDGVTLITLQGEGSPADRIDSHFGMFVSMYDEFLALSRARTGFAPVRDVQSNPLSRLHVDNSYPGWRLIQDPLTRSINDLCSSVYVLMLDVLQQVFAAPHDSLAYRQAMAELSLRMMTAVLAPLGDVLTRMPMGDDSPGGPLRPRCAGPSFELNILWRPLASGETAWPAIHAELLRLAQESKRLAGECTDNALTAWATATMVGVSASLSEFAQILP